MNNLNRRAFVALGSTASLMASSNHMVWGQTEEPLKRLSIKEFAQNAEMLASLRAAVARMRSLPPRHPFSWVFQANIHWRPFFPDYVYQQADESSDPEMQVFRDNTGFSPEVPVFNSCPHSNWWFLPWHRCYLYCFERILRWASGNSKLTLPYWNYTAADQRILPAAFRTPTISATDTTPNPLYLPSTVLFRDSNDNPQIFSVREQTLNLGLSSLSESVTNANALRIIPFTNSSPASPRDAFGSPQACDLTCQCGSGALERVPHNLVHVAIGGSAIVSGDAIRVGFMGDTSTAARDPIFWLHHCQIDRLWESWIKLADGRVNPTDPAWLTYQFSFYDVGDDGKPVAIGLTPADVLSTEALGYAYDQLESVPVSPPVPTPAALSPMMAGQFKVLGQQVAAPAFATRQKLHNDSLDRSDGIPLSLTKAKQIKLQAIVPKSAVDAEAQNLGMRAAVRASKDEGQLMLSLQGIQLAHQPGVYFEVYLGLGDDETPNPNSQSFLGTLSFFAAMHHSSTHAGPSKPLHPEMLRVPSELRAKIAAGDTNLTVTFVPRSGVVADGADGGVPRMEHANAVVVKEVKLLLVQ